MRFLASSYALVALVTLFAALPFGAMAFTTALRSTRLLSTTTRTFLSTNKQRQTQILQQESAVRRMMASSGSDNGKDSKFETEMRQKQNEANKVVSASMAGNKEHAKYQAAVFDEEAAYFASGKTIPEEVVPVLRLLATQLFLGTIGKRGRMTTREREMRPARLDMTHEKGVYHILDVGCGSGALFDYFLEAADKSGNTVHIHGLDLSSKMVEQARIHAKNLLNNDSTTKNTIKVDQGDILEWKPDHQYDLVVANACFGNFFDPPKALESMAEATTLDGWLCITHPLGSDFVRKLHEDNSTIVPHLLPTFDGFRKMARTLPIHVLGVVDKQKEDFFPVPTFYMASALKTVHRTLPNIIRLRGPVAEGYGRGGKKLGFPTANLPTSMFQEALEDLPCGVYFGWALLEDPEGKKEGRNIPLKAVVNIGFSPTFEGQENKEKVVEAHVILERNTLDPPDFYGETMRLQLSGYIRGESKFPSFLELIAQIKTDVQDTKDALEYEIYQTLQYEAFMTQSVDKEWVGNGGGDGLASWEFEDIEMALDKLTK